jgi:phytoene dehydrogenase-like protein
MAIGSPFFRQLKLESRGLRWLQPELPLAHPLDGGRAASVARSVAETAQRLGKDAEAYQRVVAPLVAEAQALFEDALAPLHFPQHPLPVARLARHAWKPATRFAKRFGAEEARALFAGVAAHGVLPLEAPVSSAIAIMLLVAAHAYGWPAPAGGAQAIGAALLRRFEELGGAVRCGVRVGTLKDLPAARAYVFDVSPRSLATICGDALPAPYRKRLLAYRYGPGVFKVDYALSAPIPWRSEACRKAGTIHVGGTFAEIAAAERAPWNGAVAERPFVLVAQPTVFDPTRAPAGRHVAWAYCHVPQRSTVDRAQAIASQIERFAPGFRDCILAQHTLNCAQLEAENPNLVGGDVVGGVTDWRQLFGRPVLRRDPYATPNDAIFLCSASTPPGGGVHGMCGYWAAESVMRRFARGSPRSRG